MVPLHLAAAAVADAKSLQSCPTLCDPIDGSPPGSAVPGILQARKLEWVAISFSNAWKWRVKVKSLSRVQLLVTPWSAAYLAPPSMGFSRQEYWNGVPLPSPIYPCIPTNQLWTPEFCGGGGYGLTDVLLPFLALHTCPNPNAEQIIETRTQKGMSPAQVWIQVKARLCWRLSFVFFPKWLQCRN